MLQERIIKAITFQRDVYAEVERDTTFTAQAWVLVIVVSFMAELGSRASGYIFNWIIGAVVGTVVTVIGFALGAYLVSWIGKSFYNADVTFEEVVRTAGLAYVWRAVGVLGVITPFIGCLGCGLGLIQFAAWIIGLVATFIALDEALDLETNQTIVVVAIYAVVMIVFWLVLGLIYAMIGLTGALFNAAF